MTPELCPDLTKGLKNSNRNLEIHCKRAIIATGDMRDDGLHQKTIILAAFFSASLGKR
jgi:hypothetical protein